MFSCLALAGEADLGSVLVLSFIVGGCDSGASRCHPFIPVPIVTVCCVDADKLAPVKVAIFTFIPFRRITEVAGMLPRAGLLGPLFRHYLKLIVTDASASP